MQPGSVPAEDLQLQVVPPNLPLATVPSADSVAAAVVVGPAAAVVAVAVVAVAVVVVRAAADPAVAVAVD